MGPLIDVSVIVATFGHERWIRRADQMASPSALAEVGAERFIRHHGGRTVAEARNAAAAQAETEWLCFLDADDELEPGYMLAMADLRARGGLLAPAVRFGDHAPAACFLDRVIATINPCVIGTLIRRQIFDAVGGFWEERAWEDWSLFRRAWLLGEPVVHVPAAVYRVHESGYGRNSTVERPKALHGEIIVSHEQWLNGRELRTVDL